MVRRRIHSTNIAIAEIRRRRRLFILVVQHLLRVLLVRILGLFEDQVAPVNRPNPPNKEKGRQKLEQAAADLSF